MPQQGNIAQYTAPVDKLSPSETGAETYARMGRVEKENYDQAGRAYGQAAQDVAKPIDDYQYMHEVSQGAAGLAAMHANLTSNWNQMAVSTDPNDTSIQQKFMDDTNDQLDQWQGSFSTKRGQQWALTQADQTREHFEVKTSADMGTRAGDAIINNLKTTLKSYSSTAYDDPSSIEHSLGQVDAIMAAKKEAAAGTLDPAQVARIDEIGDDMKNEIVKSGVKGLADGGPNRPANPQAAKRLLDSGAFNDYLKGEETAELHKYSEGVVRMQREDQQRAYENKRRAQEQTDEAASNKIINGLADPNTGQLKVPDNISQQIWQMDGVSGKTKLQLLGAVSHIGKEDIVDDPSIIKDFAGRLKSDSQSPLTQDDLLSAISVGKMTPSTYNFFNERLQNKPDIQAENLMLNQTLDQMKKTILTPLPGVPVTPSSEAAYTKFQTWFLPQYQQALKDPSLAGMSNAQKAQALLSPDSPKYMLGPETMNRFVPTQAQQLQDLTKGVGPLPGTSNQSVSPTKAPAAPPGATQTRYNAKGDAAYLIGGKWVDVNGKELK